MPRLTYRSKHDLPILLLNKDLVGVIFLILEQFLDKISGIFLSFGHFFSMNVLNMFMLHFVRKVFLSKLCFNAGTPRQGVARRSGFSVFYPGEGPFPACHKGNDHGLE